MKYKVIVVGFDYAFATAITGMVDLFSFAGVTYNKIKGQAIAPRFEVTLASEGKRPFITSSGLTLQPDAALENITHCDLICLPSIAGNLQRTLSENQALQSWLTHHHNNNTVIASNCTAAFFLAEARLLNGQTSTTHWAFADLFRQKYPEVNMTPDSSLTQSGNIYCSSGGLAWWELGLRLLEHFCGQAFAEATAKAYVMERPYLEACLPERWDMEMAEVSRWLSLHFSRVINLEQLAQKFNMSSRTFKRRFKATFAATPVQYIQQLRIEAAKQLLLNTQSSLNHIVNQVGYEDVSSFCRLFKRATGLTPKQFRSREHLLVENG